MAEIKDCIHSLNILEFTAHPVCIKTFWRWTFQAPKFFSVLKALCEFVQSLNPESEMHWEVPPAVRLLAPSPNSRISGKICTNFVCYGPHGDEQAQHSHWHETHNKPHPQLQHSGKKKLSINPKTTGKMWNSLCISPGIAQWSFETTALKTWSISTDTLPRVLLILGKKNFHRCDKAQTTETWETSVPSPGQDLEKQQLEQAELPSWRQRKYYTAEISHGEVTEKSEGSSEDAIQRMKLFTSTSSSDRGNLPSSL